MWIPRYQKKESFINALLHLRQQVLLLQGARQVGKTSFILHILKELSAYPQIKLNLLYPSSFRLEGVDYLGRDFFGKSPTGEEFLKNLENALGTLPSPEKPALIFLDEVDRYPLVMESIQTLASFSDRFKIVMTGSNLENLRVSNAATGRKKYIDLYPITFREFLMAQNNQSLLKVFNELSFNTSSHSDYYHTQLSELHNIYIRLGGMPRLASAYLDPTSETQSIPELMKDLAVSIEENVKTILGEKAILYEYEDVLRKLAALSMNTLKFTHLQVQHAGRQEAKRLVFKTVGARVAHKIRLWEAERDLSKYLLFDCGLVNYLLAGSHLLTNKLSETHLAILLETFVGNELIAHIASRDDLCYWKSGNRAEVEFLLRSPYFVGIDVKTTRGDHKSLNSLALFEKEVEALVKVTAAPPSINKDYIAKLPNLQQEKKTTLINLPHYLLPRLLELLEEVL